MRDFRPNAKPASRLARVRTPKSTQKPNPNVTQTRSLDSCGKYFRTVALVVAAGSLAARMPWENAVRGREGVTRLQKRSCLSPLNPHRLRSGQSEAGWALRPLSPMLQPTSLVHDNTAAVPTKVAAAGSNNAQGTLEHAHNPRAHACVPDHPSTCPLLVEDDQEHRAHDPTVKTPTVGTTVTNQLSDTTQIIKSQPNINTPKKFLPPIFLHGGET